MSIQTACPSCQKLYAAADAMAGRRVRCRGCGVIFALTPALPVPPAPTVPAVPPATHLPTAARFPGRAAHPDDTHGPASAGTGPGPGLGPVGNAASPAGRLATDAAEAFRIPPPTSSARPKPAAPANPFDAPDLTSVATDSDAVFTRAFAEYRPAIRPNVLHNYPYAYLLDRWVPPVLIAIASLWLVVQVSMSNDAGVGWAIALRLFLAGAGYLLIVFPLGWLGMSLGCRWARFARPPSPGRRVVAATFFPYVLLLVLWILAGRLADAIPGVFVALIVGVGLAWLLYRPSPEESAVSLTAAGVALVLAIAVCVAGLLGANEAARSIAKTSRPSPQLAGSPVGPGLPWEPPSAGPVEVRNPPTAVNSVEPAGSSASGDAAVPSTLPGGDGVVTPMSPPSASSSAPSSEMSAATRPGLLDPLQSSLLFGQGPPPTRPASMAPTPAAPAGDPPVADASTGDPLADRIRAAESPLVAAVLAPKEVQPFERVVFSASPSACALFVRPAPDDNNIDALDVWNLQTLTRVGSATARRDERDDPVTGNYVLHPSGRRVARIGGVTTVGVDFLSIGDAVDAPARIELPLHQPFMKNWTQPRVVGFGADDRVLVRWEDGPSSVLQVVDLKQGGGKAIPLPRGAWLPGSRALSPDRRWFATVGDAGSPNAGTTDARPRPVLALVDVVSQSTRTVAIQGIDPELALSPSGVAFSLDGQQVAILYERGARAVLLALTLAAKPPAAGANPFLIFLPPAVGTPLPDEGVVPASGRLCSVSEGRAWLVGGNVVTSAATGRSLGALGVPELLGAVGFEQSIAVIRDDGGPRRLILLRLSPSVAATQPANP